MLISLALLVVAALAISSSIAPETSTIVTAPENASESNTSDVDCLLRENGAGCLHFPICSGENLLGEEITFPTVFSTDYVLAVMLFSREQQNRAIEWLPLAEELGETYPNLSIYGIPIFPDVADYARVLARGGFLLMLDGDLHDKLVMIFLENREDFLEVLEIPDLDDIQVLLMNTSGDVLWRISGDFTEERGEALREQVSRLSSDGTE